MLSALLACSAAVLAAAAPGPVLAVHDLTSAQHRLDAARLATRAAVLGHDLGDERDDLASARAAGGDAGSAPVRADRARTDRRFADVTAAAPAALRAALARLPAIRRRAATAPGGPRAVIDAYQPLLDALGRVAGQGTAPLTRAVTAAGVERGLLVAAMAGGGGQSALVSAARIARVQEQAALADFRATAPAALRDRYEATVTGADTAGADRDLAALLAGPDLTGADRALGTGRVRSALDARLALMRGVETSGAGDEEHAAAAHRGHEITVLELRVLLGLSCLALVVGVLVTFFRTLTRPLAALHAWSGTEGGSGQGAEVIGGDEFADVARRVNALTQEAQALRSRVSELTAAPAAAAQAHAAPSSEREGLLRDRDELLRTRDDLLRSREELADRLTRATVRNAAHLTHVNLALRTLGLIERQLALIDGLEEQEQDPDRLAAFFQLDHLATRMRRNSENLLVLAGAEPPPASGAEPPPASGGGTPDGAPRPVPIVDVARAALSEVEGYERVRIGAVPEGRLAGRAACDVSHLIAELLDNAAAFSDPAAEIRLSGETLDDGEVVLRVEDSGIGVPPERLPVLNALLADPDPAPPGAASGMGLFVVARLAHRHGVRVRLLPLQAGGTAAVVVLPRLLLPVLGPDEPEGMANTAGATGMEAPAAREAPEALTAPAAPAVPGPAKGTVTPVAMEAVEAARAPETTWAPESPAAAAGTGAAGTEAAGVVPVPVRVAVPAQRTEAAPEAAPAVPPAVSPAAMRPSVVGAAHAGPHAAAGTEPVRPSGGALTARGLPQRVPRSTGPGVRPAVRRPGPVPAGPPVDAETLRRQLGGLQEGLRAGRRDAERELREAGRPGGAGGTRRDDAVGGPGRANGAPGRRNRHRANGTDGGDDGDRALGLGADMGKQGDVGGQAATVEEATR